MNRKFSISRIPLSTWFTLVWGLLVFAFFAFRYQFHLNYQEQYQMFLFTGEYLRSYLSTPGGMASYLGNFFTQFYFYSTLGAGILAILFVLFQKMLWHVFRILQVADAFLPLSALPAILYWGLLCDENYLLGGFLAFLISLGFTLIFIGFKNEKIQLAFALIGTPILYWISGGAFVVFVGLVLVYSLCELKMKRLTRFAALSILLVLASISPLVAKQLVPQFPLMRLLLGVNFYRFPVTVPYTLAVIAALIVALPFVMSLMSRRFKQKIPIWISALVAGVVLVLASVFVLRSADMDKEEVMAYDFYTRMRRWNKVIEMADRKVPASPLSVTSLNLALAQEGQLSSRMFHYYQNGMQGLMPDFVRDFTSPMVVGEVYYHLGFVNTAQRFAFEAMEALPDYQKSSRAVMRLAETNIINGDYAVATKYLRWLQKTFYYRKWATNALKTIQSEDQIAAHGEWSVLRSYQVKDDFLFSENEKDMMLGLFFTHNPKNWMAFEYLMAYCLLNKDLDKFMQYYPLIQKLNYRQIPLSYQEALVYAWQVAKPHEQMPFAVNQSVVSRFAQYGQIYHGQTNRETALKANFANTFWFYYHFR